MSNELHREMNGFPERIYVSTEKEYTGYGAVYRSVATDDLDEAVRSTSEEVEVGIYQLVRVAKFKKTAVEIKSTVKEVL